MESSLSPLNRTAMPLLAGTLVCATLGIGVQAAEDASRRAATYSVQHSLTVKEIPRGAKRVRMWFWVPQEDDAQKLLNLTVTAPGKYSIQRDPTYGSNYLYCEVRDPGTDTLALNTEFVARRHEARVVVNPSDTARISPEQQQVFADQLRRDVPHMEVDERIRTLADQVCGSETSVVKQARLLYDYVIERAEHYSKGPNAPKSSQLGSASYCLTQGGGACTDLHALFIALARARNIPTRLYFGSRLQPQNEGKETDPGYRCWVTFFAPQYGWVPCDLAAGDTVAGKRDYYFGCLDERRLVFNEGRDLVLTPIQNGKRVNLVIGAYVEVNGKPHPTFERRLKYTEVK